MTKREILEDSIHQRALITFSYHGVERIVEPYLYGYFDDRHGEAVFGYQVRGSPFDEALPKWRLFFVSEIEELEIAYRRFEGPRPEFNPQEAHLKEVFTKL